MSSRVRVLLIALGLLAALAAPCRAENPAVSLKVENATFAEAAAQLSKAARIPVQLYTANKLPIEKPKPNADLEERASFDWSHVTFAQALRQLCERYHLYPGEHAGGCYVLYNAQMPVALPDEKPPRPFEKNGVRLFVRGISIDENRSADFEPNGFGGGGASASVTIGCRLLNGDGETIAGIENASAKDDLGSLLIANGSDFYHPGSGPYPDEWNGSIAMTPPLRQAKKLVWLEGDLMVYRTFKHHRIEIPFPIAGKSIHKEIPGLIFCVSEYRPGAEPLPDPNVDLPIPGEVPQEPRAGFTVRLRQFFASDAQFFPRPWARFSYIEPEAIGASGRVYPVFEGAGRGSRTWQQGMLSDEDYGFAMDEPPTKLVFDFVEKSDPQKLLTFRMTNIPLPLPVVIAPARRIVTPPSASAAPRPEWPYYERGGGMLLSPVRIAGRPAVRGTLSVGLAVKQGGEWSAIRWQTVDVGKDGTAKLEDMKPGTYRLLRIYRPSSAPATSRVPGRWHNDEVTITITAGKEIVPPALRWVPQPLAAPRVKHNP